MKTFLLTLILLSSLGSLSADEELRFNLSSPVVSDKQLFVGTFDGLVSVDLRLKRIKWRSLIGWVDIPPVVTTREVFGATIQGYVHALNRHDGKIIWKVDAGKPILNRFVVHKSQLFVQVGSTIIAYDMRSSRRVWSYSAGQEFIGPMVISNNVIYLPTRSHLSAIRLKDSERIWFFSWSHAQVADLVVVGERIVVLGDSTLYCFQKTKGTLLWRYNNGYSSNAMLNNEESEDGQTFPLMSLPHDARSIFTGIDVIRKVDVSTGRFVWSKNIGSASDLMYPAIIHDLLCWPAYPELQAISVDTGKNAWKTRIEKTAIGGVITMPVSSESQLFFTDGYSKLYSIHLKTGEVLWQIDLVDESSKRKPNSAERQSTFR